MLHLLDRRTLAAATWAKLTRTQRYRLRMLAWTHTVYGDACADGIAGKNARGSLRVLERERVIEWFLGHGGFRRVRPTPFGYEVLAAGGYRYDKYFATVEAYQQP